MFNTVLTVAIFQEKNPCHSEKKWLKPLTCSDGQCVRYVQQLLYLFDNINTKFSCGGWTHSLCGSVHMQY